MELIAYVIMAAGAFVSLLTKRRAIVYGWFALYALYSVAVRVLPPTLDMVVYSQALARSPPVFTFYTLREPVVWIGASLLHDLIDDRVATFLLIDLLIGLIVFRSMKILDDGSGRTFAFAPTILVSYVLLIGQQNILRQHVAFALLLWAIAARSRNRFSSVPLYILAFLTHNATALFFGYWFDTGRPRARVGPLLTLLAVIALAFTFPLFRRSPAATGLSTEYLYVALACGVLFLLLYTTSGRFARVEAPGLLNFLAFAPAIGILSSAQFERLAMMFLLLSIIDIQRHHRSLRIGSAETAIGAYAVLVIPVFLFPSAFNLLLT